MKRLYHIFPVLILLLLSNLSIAGSYRIVLKGKGVVQGDYVLYGWDWGTEYAIDTVSARSGKALFKGKCNLAPGTYKLGSIDGKKILEFIVPRNNKGFSIGFTLKEKGFKVNFGGNRENVLFSDFQNLLNYGWEEMENKEDFVARIEGMKEKASKEFPGSISDIIFRNTLTTPENAQQIRENFPFGDTILAHTHFIGDKIGQYLKILQYNHNDTIRKYVYDMIGSGANSTMKGKLAHSAYNFFYNSKIMGQEEIAVNIAQDWFLNGKLEWPDEEGKFMLRTFVEFNRHSLLGMEAPELNLIDTSGNAVSLHSLDAEYKIIYFYTSDCATCRKETPELVDFINGYSQGPLAVYAVYADNNVEKWKDYINSELYIFNPFMNWVNVYDPDYGSGFQILYNVIKTPQMFLLDKENRIIGRGLSVGALKELLQARNTQRDKLRSLIEGYFSPIADDTTAIRGGIETLYNRSSHDTDLCKEFVDCMYTTLMMSDEYTLQEGAILVAEKYILGMPQLWNSRYIEKVREHVRRFNMNRLGTKAAEITLERVDGSSIMLSDITNEYKVLYFYRPNCGMCSMVTPKMAELYNKYKGNLDIEFVAINLSGSYNEWVEYIGESNAGWENVRGIEGDSSPIYEAYWLQEVPAIYLLKDNIVVAKEINDLDLEEILKNIIQ